jgi:hypothetical protein
MLGFVNDAVDMTLDEFIKRFPPPQYAKVTQGYLDSNTPDNEFSTNDLIKVTSHSDKRFL